MPMKTLLVGYRAGDLDAKALEGDVVCHVLDVYDRHAIEKAWGAKCVCSPHLPEGPWDLVRFRTGPKVMSGELSLDLLQEIHLLKPAKFELDFVGRERDRNDLLAKIKDDPDRVRSFAATWPASVPGGPRLTFTSFPGCFCHRRLDEGGLALAEVVSRELGPAPRARRLTLLDMGAGCGLVGFLVASAVPGIALTMVDSHTRAVEAARLNSANLGIPADVVLSDDGTPPELDGSFDVFVGNPPYYSEYRIADVFLATAARALKPGGVCYMVCKNADGLRPVQLRHFAEVQVVNRRGYAVLKSQKGK
ncbi:MAG: methyltransferase [Kiritimatiellae bacterium]|nr:methyltransferase [Kiritimatiellia bacterium]